MLRAGIVGLPNVGKSTLFNAITRTRKAEAANYPFCTIDPNVGMVTVPDARLAELQRIAKTGVVDSRGDRVRRHRGPGQGREPGRGARQQVPHPRARSGRHGPGRPLLRGRRRPPRLGDGRSGARHRGDQHRADALRPRVGQEAPRARRQGRQARRQGRGGRRRRARENRGRARRGQAGAVRPTCRPRSARPPEPSSCCRTSRRSSRATSPNPTWRRRTRNPARDEGARLRQHAPGLRGGRHQRADRERPRRPLARRKRRSSSSSSA